MTPRSARRRGRARRGVALVVVLWTILLLASVAAVASSASRTSADVAAARRAGAVARAMAESGIVAGVARIDATLGDAAADSTARYAYLDALEASVLGRGLVADTLGDGVFVVTVVDVSARLDANSAGVEGWGTLLRPHVGSARADRIARAIDARVRGEDIIVDERARARDSLSAALLGRAETAMPVRRPFETIDELLDVPGLDPALLSRLAPLLTVDGNGSVNRRAARPEVLAAASGSLVDHPARLLVVSRGWMRGHPLTREIEAVYDVADDGLRLVRWRERER